MFRSKYAAVCVYTGSRVNSPIDSRSLSRPLQFFHWPLRVRAVVGPFAYASRYAVLNSEPCRLRSPGLRGENGTFESNRSANRSCRTSRPPLPRALTASSARPNGARSIRIPSPVHDEYAKSSGIHPVQSCGRPKMEAIYILPIF